MRAWSVASSNAGRVLESAGHSAGWLDLARYLRSSHGADVVDRAVYGALPTWEADELLADFVQPGFLELDDADRRPARRQLGRLIDELLTSGAA